MKSFGEDHFFLNNIMKLESLVDDRSSHIIGICIDIGWSASKTIIKCEFDDEVEEN